MYYAVEGLSLLGMVPKKKNPPARAVYCVASASCSLHSSLRKGKREDDVGFSALNRIISRRLYIQYSAYLLEYLDTYPRPSDIQPSISHHRRTSPSSAGRRSPHDRPFLGGGGGFHHRRQADRSLGIWGIIDLSVSLSLLLTTWANPDTQGVDLVH